MRKLLLVSTVCALLVGATIGAGVAQARLDRSFGHNGVVDVRPPLPAPWQRQYITELAGAWDGSSFALSAREYCPDAVNCHFAAGLYRYLGNGSLDPGFGGPGGSYEMPREGEGALGLTVDSRGRPLLTRATAGHVAIRRLTTSGALDPEFGAGGVVTFGCDCRYPARLVPGGAGKLTVILPGRRPSGAVFTVMRLRADGSRDPEFGPGGSTTFGLGGTGPFVGLATTRRGALYLSGGECCGLKSPGYVSRVSASGRFDSRFTAASRRSLRRIQQLGALEADVNAVIPRRGKIDILGSAGYQRGFIARLNPNGELRRTFGSNGLRMLPVPVASAALGSDGAILAVSDGNVNGNDVLMRILSSGRSDPAFGVEGEQIPTTGRGVSVVPQSGRKALVLGAGLMECRGNCPAEPKLVRFLEGARRRR